MTFLRARKRSGVKQIISLFNVSKSKGGPSSAGARFRAVATAMIGLFLFGSISPALARPYSAAQDHTRSSDYYSYAADPAGKNGGEGDSSDNERVLLKGYVNYRVPKGTPIKLKLSIVPTSGLRLMDRDLDGNLHPAKKGQHITAKTTEDIFVGTNKVIPEGTIFHGEVSKIYPQRRVGRPGHLDIAFSHLVLPDGKQFAFRAEADNFKKSTVKTKAKGFGIIAAHAAGGAVLGALVAYQIFGLKYTIQMHGYNIAGGAAAGALLATGFAIMRKGPKATLEPGDDLNMRINTDLLIPIAQKPSIHKKGPPEVEGLNIRILKMKKKRDGLGNKVLFLDLSVDNSTSKRFKSIDLFAEDSNGNRNALSSAGGFEETISFEIEPHSLRRLKICFTLEWPKLPHKLVWLDHHTRQPVHVMPLF